MALADDRHSNSDKKTYNTQDEHQSAQDKIAHLLNEAENLQKKLKDNDDLSRFFKDVSLLLGLIKDYYLGNYRVVPYTTIAAAVVGLLYVINPIDLIPDFIPVIGYIDDAVVIALCLRMAERDLKKYARWKQSQTTSNANNQSDGQPKK